MWLTVNSKDLALWLAYWFLNIPSPNMPKTGLKFPPVTTLLLFSSDPIYFTKSRQFFLHRTNDKGAFNRYKFCGTYCTTQQLTNGVSHQYIYRAHIGVDTNGLWHKQHPYIRNPPPFNMSIIMCSHLPPPASLPHSSYLQQPLPLLQDYKALTADINFVNVLLPLKYIFLFGSQQPQVHCLIPPNPNVYD